MPTLSTTEAEPAPVQSLTEKRVYGEQGGARTCLVASDTGLVVVRVTGTAVGEFSLADRRPVRDVAVGMVPSGADAARTIVAVATDEDVLVASLSDLSGVDDGDGPAAERDGAADSESLSDALVPTDFGPAVGVDVGLEAVVAASPDGEIRMLAVTGDGPLTDSSWAPIDGPAVSAAEPADPSDGPPDLSVTAIDAPLVATDRGVFRIQDGMTRPAGLAGVRDVDTTGTPLAGTASGLYALGNGWQALADDPTDAVAAAPAVSTDESTRPHAVSGSPRIFAVSGPTLYALDLDASGGDPTRQSIARADDPLVDLALCPAGYVYAISSAGTVLAVGPDEVRHHALGVRDPAGIAFVDAELSP